MFVDAKDAFLLRSNTILKIKHHKNKKRIVGFEVIKGGVLSVFSKKKRKIRTPSALIGIRGTGVYIEVDKEKSFSGTIYEIDSWNAEKFFKKREDLVKKKEEEEVENENAPNEVLNIPNNPGAGLPNIPGTLIPGITPQNETSEE